MSRRLGGGSRDRRLMAETIRAFRCRLGSREPEAAPLRFFTSLGAVTIPGACNISRPLGRASALLFRNDARSVASGGLLFFRGPVAGAERSPHAPAPPRIGHRPACCSGGLFLRWPVAGVERSSAASVPRGMEAGHAPPYTSSHRIFWFGRDIFSSRPSHRDRRRAQPPSRPAPFRAAAGLVLTAASTMAASGASGSVPGGMSFHTNGTASRMRYASPTS